ncbi:MAG: hypothetical protein Q4Q20_04575, partial [Methanocorpusculum sp.]|nr:hypothetical protein [Methanocorpusculum sp.]
MTYHKKTELKRAAAGLAVLLLAAFALTGAAAAADDVTSNPLTGGAFYAFYYENVEGFDGVYKYLDNVIDMTNSKVLEPSSSRPEGQYASTTTTDGFILKKLDADVSMYVYSDDKTKIISSAIGSTVPRGS